MHALGRECKGIAPPWAKLSSLGPKGPWDDNIALGGAIPLHSLPRACNYLLPHSTSVDNLILSHPVQKSNLKSFYANLDINRFFEYILEKIKSHTL